MMGARAAPLCKTIALSDPPQSRAPLPPAVPTSPGQTACDNECTVGGVGQGAAVHAEAPASANGVPRSSRPPTHKADSTHTSPLPCPHAACSITLGSAHLTSSQGLTGMDVGMCHPPSPRHKQRHRRDTVCNKHNTTSQTPALQSTGQTDPCAQSERFGGSSAQMQRTRPLRVSRSWLCACRLRCCPWLSEGRVEGRVDVTVQPEPRFVHGLGGSGVAMPFFFLFRTPCSCHNCAVDPIAPYRWGSPSTSDDGN